MRKKRSWTLSRKEEREEVECDKCKNGWIIARDSRGYEVAKECECMKMRRMKNLLKFANIPDAFKDMRLETFRVDVYKDRKSKEDIKIVVDIVKEYFKIIEKNLENGQGLYFYSETKGSGKTRLAASIANELIHKHNIHVKFAVSTQIINEIKRTWDRESEYTESKLLDALSAAKVLVIDDFGTEQVKGWINDKYYSILNERYINKKVTIFTSNCSIKGLPYNDRIINRVEEMAHPVPFPNESIRSYIAEQKNNEMINRIVGGKE